MRHRAAGTCITAGVLFPSRVPLEWSCWPRILWSGTGGFQEQGQCFFIGLRCSIPTLVFYYFSLSLLSVYRLVLWAGCFGLIGCISLSFSLALPTFFTNHNYNNNNNIKLFHLNERNLFINLWRSWFHRGGARFQQVVLVYQFWWRSFPLWWFRIDCGGTLSSPILGYGTLVVTILL